MNAMEAGYEELYFFKMHNIKIFFVGVIMESAIKIMESVCDSWIFQS